MADDESKDTSTSAGENPTPGKEIVRIAMPPRPGDVPQSKSEAARVNVPGKTARSALPPIETDERNQNARTNMPGREEMSKDAAPPVNPALGGAKPSFPAPPMPKPPVSAPPSTPRPPNPPAVAGSAPKPPFVPKPPTLRTKPSTMPAAPLTPASSPSGTKESNRGPVAAAGSAKKETARIQAPSHNKELSRATLKMEQPKPFPVAPVTEIEPAEKGENSAMTWLAIAALLAAALSLFFSYLAFTSA